MVEYENPDGEDRARKGLKLFFIPVLIFFLEWKIIWLPIAEMEAKEIPLDDSNAAGWIIGYFGFPLFIIATIFYVMGAIKTAKSESMYKHYLKMYPNKNISSKRKRLHYVCSIVNVIVILIPIIVFLVLIISSLGQLLK